MAIHDSHSGSDSDSVTIPTQTNFKNSSQHLRVAAKTAKLPAHPAVKFEPASSSPFATPASQRGKAKVKQPKQEQALSSSLFLAMPSMPETGLPLFINQKWLALILPTLYHCLYASKEPFAFFVKGSPDFMGHIIKILDRTIVGHTYTVTPGSAYAKRVCSFYLMHICSHVL